MKIIVDESASIDIVHYLRDSGHHVLAITEGDTAGLEDKDVLDLAKTENAILITHDRHFKNSQLYPPQGTAGLLYIRKGTLTPLQEGELIKAFLNSHPPSQFAGRLVTLSKDKIQIR